MASRTGLSQTPSLLLGIMSRVLSFPHMRMAVCKLRRLHRQSAPREEGPHHEMGMVAGVEGISQMAMEGEADMKGLEGVGAEAAAASMTEETLEAYRPVNGVGASCRRSENPALDGEGDGKGGVDAEEGDGRLDSGSPRAAPFPSLSCLFNGVLTSPCS